MAYLYINWRGDKHDVAITASANRAVRAYVKTIGKSLFNLRSCEGIKR